jgi:hypothetical protein
MPKKLIKMSCLTGFRDITSFKPSSLKKKTLQSPVQVFTNMSSFAIVHSSNPVNFEVYLLMMQISFTFPSWSWDISLGITTGCGL